MTDDVPLHHADAVEGRLTHGSVAEYRSCIDATPVYG
jgi:hypothetical protein